MIIASIYELREENDCHNPAGAAGGQFCSKDHGPRSGLASYPHDKRSRSLPSYLKMDVLRARRAGIEVFHQQQPEPIRDARGKIMDPLAMSNARRGETFFYDENDRRTLAPSGRIVITTRGGEFEPTETVYDPSDRFMSRPTRKPKELKPGDLTDPATPDDVTSTFRHEMGHILDQNFSGSKSKSTPAELARELRAWVYAVEASPDHTVSNRMVTDGLESHAYAVFRKQAILKENPYLSRGYSFELEERLDRVFQNELRDRKPLDEASAAKASAFAARALKALNKYGNTLRRKGAGVPDPPVPPHYIPKSLLPTPGPGRGSGRTV